VRTLAKKDLFFLLYFVLDFPVNHPFLIARIYEVQDKNDFTLDLWSREHFKSSIITCGMSIFDILQNRENRVGIFSHTGALAKKHLDRIKLILEGNDILKTAFPDIFYKNPRSQSRAWSTDVGLLCRRKGHYVEMTFQAHGLIDSMPTGMHFSVMVYDDIVSPAETNTPEMMKKLEERYRLSINLGARGGKRRVIGTRYNLGDVYGMILKQPKWIPRIYPAEVDGEGKALRDGKSVMLGADLLQEKKDEMGEYIYSSQMLQNPVAASHQKFKIDWIRFNNELPEGMNLYLLVDPAHAKKKTSDYTVYWVIGAAQDRTYRVVTVVRDRFNLGERCDMLFRLVQKYGIQEVAYESYGMQADAEYIREKMTEKNYYFNLVEVGGIVKKEDRIKRLIPLFEKQRFVFPENIFYFTEDGERHDLVYDFIYEEYLTFPFSAHDDMLDALARITEGKLNIVFPTFDKPAEAPRKKFNPLDSAPALGNTSWMAR
jgi:phage terminase large subunit-like protein